MLGLNNDITYTPRHQHDCSTCTYMGTLQDCDVYICAQGQTIPTIIVRHGEGPKYGSGASFITSGTFFRTTVHDAYGAPLEVLAWTNIAAAVIAQWAIKQVVPQKESV